MGVDNRQRRAAKQRRRARQDARRDRRGADGAPADDLTTTIAFLAEAGRATEEGGVDVAVHYARALAGTDLPQADRVLDAAAAACLRHLLPILWQHGWQPVDLTEVVRRRVDPLAATLLADALAAVTREHAAATVDPRWQAQVDRVCDGQWWEPGRPHLSQWSGRHGVGRVETITTLIRLLAAITALPVIAVLVPPPGAARAARTDGRHGTGGVDERVLAKVRGLLAKAESTEFAEEAEALSAKAQELMTRYALERAVVEADAGPPRASARRLWIDNPYAEPKSLLVAAVADANRSRAVASKELGFVTVLGDAGDLDLVELLATSLLVQATAAMVGAGRHADRRGVSRTRSFRQSFLVAYAGRIGERLREAAETATGVAEETDARLLPVLSARREAVEHAVDDMFPHLVTRTVGVGNAAGYGAGRAAADLARLDARSAVAAPPDRPRTDR